MFIIQIKGGLGNRIFQYNFYFWLKKRYPQTDIHVCTDDEPVEKTHPFFRNIPSISAKDCAKKRFFCRRLDDSTFSGKRLSAHRNYYFDGYWMAGTFLDDPDLFCRFLNSVTLNDHNRELLEKIQHSESVFVHIRRGDMEQTPLFHNIATEEYFQNAIELASQRINDPVFFIFSDDPDWCRKLSCFAGKRVSFQDFNITTPDQDMFLMAQCRHAVCSYSSFSFWGQYLIPDDRFKVTPPRYLNTPEILPMPPFRCESVTNILRREQAGEHPMFSLIISCYQAESYVRTSLVSVCNQTESDFEVICVDDCSTDRTVEVIQEFMTLDRRIRLIRHEKNQGQFHARKTGLAQAKGKYCWFLDVDDYIEPDALSVLRKTINSAFEPDIIRFHYQMFDVQNGVVIPCEESCGNAGTYAGQKDILSWGLRQNPTAFAIWQNVFRRDFLTGSARHVFNLSPVRHAEDIVYALFPFYAEQVVELDNVLYDYRLPDAGHDSELTSKSLLCGIIRNTDLLLQSIGMLELSQEEKFAIRTLYANGFMLRVSSCLLYLPAITVLSLSGVLHRIARYASPDSVCGIWKIYLIVMKRLPFFSVPLFQSFWSLGLKVKNVSLLLKTIWKRLPVAFRDRVAFFRQNMSFWRRNH